MPDLTLPEKLNVASTVAFIAVAALIAYATVRMLKSQKKLDKHMGLDGDDA
jgi:hypothetical protein